MNNNTKLLCLLLKSQKIATSSEQGYSMLMVSMITIVMFSLLLAATTLSNITKSRTNAFVDGNSAFYVAEAGLNKRAAEISKKLDYPGVSGSGSGNLEGCFTVGIPAGGSGESIRSGNNDLECVNYRFTSSNNVANLVSTSGGGLSLDSRGQNQNTYVAYTLVTERTNRDSNGLPQFEKIIGGEYAGLNAFNYTYVISAVGRKPVALTPGSSVPVYTNAQIAAKNRQTTNAAPQANDPALITAYDNITTAAKTAANSSSNTTAAQDSSNNTTLSMTFIKRVIPLFQFGIFYNGDLELNSTSNMEINGRVHSNANMYLQPAGLTGVTATATFMSKVSAVGSIYNRVDAWPLGLASDRPGITRFLRTGTTNTYDNLTNDRSLADPLSATKINEIPNKQLIGATAADGATAAAAGATALKTPSPGFTRKRNYTTNAIGEYFAKADLRLEMVPDRDIVSSGGTITNMSGKGTSAAPTIPWTRNKAIVPFNFTAITTGGTGTCTTTLPTAGNDPVATYVDPLRDNFSALHCNVFNKGQLQSLRQPVMVLTNINQNRAGTATTPDFKALERQILGAPTTLPTPPTLSLAANTDDTKKQIIRALQVAIASTPTPISLDKLEKQFDDATTFTTGDLAAFKSTFSTLLNNITLDASDRYNLLRAKPTEIAALQINGRGAWFLPAPIQRIERPTHTDSSENNSLSYQGNSNPRNSGFYDGRERRWITMLQTNIASLSVWNRDGLYVDADDVATEDLKTAYSPGTNAATTTLAIVTTAGVTTGVGTTNNTDGLAFDRVTTFTTGSTEIYPVGSLQYLGLGSRDKTEGGLVFHATVSDDLDGSGGALVAANDITIGSNDDQRILKKNAQGQTLDADGVVTTTNPLVIDRYRTYHGQTASRQSPFAFAVNGGNYLPNALMLSSDQSVYVQGNFNNNGATVLNTALNTPSADRLPAAIVADTITVLSNQCIGGSIVPSGQLSCGLPPQINGATQLYNSVTSPIAINAAFLSNTQVSRGNKGTGRGSELSEANRSYSGGVNNYIRLLEDWNNGDNPIALNYRGSLISLNEPIEYGGPYRSGGTDPADPVGTSYYNVPFRNFGYDTNFDAITKIPPLTPKVSFTLQNGFTRKY
jgi:Tfp pilus assembly protein PilX